MQYIVWAGGALTVLGLIGLVGCVIAVMKARKQDLDDEAMRAVLQKVLPYNLGTLGLSVLGLMLVMVGLMLG